MKLGDRPFRTTFPRLARSIALVGVLAAFAMGSSATARVADTAPVDAELADLDFLIGHWIGQGEPAKAPEELWLPEREGVMAAVFRWPSVGGRYVLELITIAKVNGAIVLRFKHFGPEVEAWEKGEANTYTLVGLANSCAQFRSATERPGVPKGLEYCRTAERTLRFRAIGDESSFDDASFVIRFDLFESERVSPRP